MSELLGCELCEREGVEAVGTTHLGGHRFEVCAVCRIIVKTARRQIESLSHPAIFCFPEVQNPSLHPRNWTAPDQFYVGRTCPNCRHMGTLGPANVDGHPGCARCLYVLQPDDYAVVAT